MVKRRYLCLMMVIMFICCSCSISRAYPTEGIWYCEELKMSIDFSMGAGQGGVKIYASDGSYETFACQILDGSIFIANLQDASVHMKGSFKYKSDVFCFEAEDGITYSFLRVDEINTDD